MAIKIPHEAWEKAGEILKGYPVGDSCANAVCAVLEEVAPLIVEANKSDYRAVQERWPGDVGQSGRQDKC